MLECFCWYGLDDWSRDGYKIDGDFVKILVVDVYYRWGIVDGYYCMDDGCGDDEDVWEEEDGNGDFLVLWYLEVLEDGDWDGY